MVVALTVDEVRESVEAWRESGYSKRGTATRLGISRNAVRNRLIKARKLNLLTEEDLRMEEGLIRANSPESSKRKPAKSTLEIVKVDELIDQERLDHAKIVREAMKRLGTDECMLDESFRRDLNIAQHRWKHVRDLDEFRNCQIMLPNKKRVWCHPDARDDLMRLDGVRGV